MVSSVYSGPFLDTLNIWRCSRLGTQEGTIIWRTGFGVWGSGFEGLGFKVLEKQRPARQFNSAIAHDSTPNTCKFLEHLRS